MGFLKFIAIFFLVLFLLAQVSKLLLRYYLKKMQKRYKDQHNQYQRESTREGDVHMSHSPNKDKIVDKDVGDYVDYEEVD